MKVVSRQSFYVFEILFILILYTFTVFAFIFIGPSNFADYNAYVAYRFSDEGFSFEYITRSILAYQGTSSNGLNAADYLVAFVCAWSIVFFFLSARRDTLQLHGFVVFSLFFFPFILTTGLRVSPLYPLYYFLISELNRGRITFLRTILFTIISAPLFHDSAFVILAITIASIPFILMKQYAALIPACAMFFSAILFVLDGVAEFPIETMLAFQLLLGERSNYLGAHINNNLASTFYFFAIWCIMLLALRDRFMRVELKIFSSLLLLFVAICSMVSSITAVRFSHFLFIVLFAGRSCMIFSIERKKGANLIFDILYLPIFFAQLLQVIK